MTDYHKRLKKAVKKAWNAAIAAGNAVLFVRDDSLYKFKDGEETWLKDLEPRVKVTKKKYKLK